MSKSERIRNYLAGHPDASAKEVATKLKVTPGLVHQVRSARRKGRRRRESSNGNGDAAGLIAAARLLNVCGGDAGKAREAIETAGQVAHVLGQ